MKKVFLFLFAGLFATALSAQIRVEISYKELPKDVAKYITAQYNGYTVLKVIEGQVDGKAAFYDVTVSKGTEKKVVTFDKDGKFVKDELVPAVPKAEPAPSPAPMPKVEVPTTAPADTIKR